MKLVLLAVLLLSVSINADVGVVGRKSDRVRALSRAVQGRTNNLSASQSNQFEFVPIQRMTPPVIAQSNDQQFNFQQQQGRSGVQQATPIQQAGPSQREQQLLQQQISQQQALISQGQRSTAQVQQQQPQMQQQPMQQQPMQQQPMQQQPMQQQPMQQQQMQQQPMQQQPMQQPQQMPTGASQREQQLLQQQIAQQQAMMQGQRSSVQVPQQVQQTQETQQFPQVSTVQQTQPPQPQFQQVQPQFQQVQPQLQQVQPQLQQVQPQLQPVQPQFQQVQPQVRPVQPQQQQVQQQVQPQFPSVRQQGDEFCRNAQPGDIVPHPQFPSQFVICYGFGEFTVMDCPQHLVYNPHLQRCDLHLEEPQMCASNPCQNNGKCVELGSAFRCECPVGFAGQVCERQDSCTARPCGGDGFCLPMQQGSPVGHVCICNGGRTFGQTCAQAESNPCLTPGANMRMFPTSLGAQVFAHCEGARPHFKFCQAPLVFSPSKQSCDWL